MGLARTLTAECGVRGVPLNAVCPEWVKTEMDAAELAEGSYTDADIPEREPMGRFVLLEDTARAIAFLVEESGSGVVNGAILAMDEGGLRSGAGSRSGRASGEGKAAEFRLAEIAQSINVSAEFSNLGVAVFAIHSNTNWLESSLCGAGRFGMSLSE